MMNAAPPLFWKRVATVLGGSIAAQALPLLAAPLITRLCTPQEMGQFSVWLGIVAVAAIGATLRLETAMILDHRAAEQRLCLTIISYCAAAAALLLTTAAAIARLSGWGPAQQLSWFAVPALGAAVWLTALTQTTLAYATSHNAFGLAAKARICAAGGIALAQLGLLARSSSGSDALIAGQLLGLAGGLYAATRLLAPPRGGPRPGAPHLRYLCKHRAFWRYALPANLMNATVGQLPLLLVGLRHGIFAAGLLALTQRVLAAPISLMAASVLEVFKRQCVHEAETSGHCRDAYTYAFKALLLLALAPALCTLLLAPRLFGWIFGDAWRPAGELAQILAPLYFLNFIASPLSYVFYVAGKQKVELLWQTALLLMTVCAFATPLTLRGNVLAYTVGYSLLYLLYLQLSYRYSGSRRAGAAMGQTP